MTDEELMKRLREGATWDDDVAAADRIEALTAERDEHWKSFVHWRKEADALTEQLEAARADAKEAEAYAEELERDLKTCRMAQAVMEKLAAELEKENTRLSGLMSERGQMLRRYDQMVVDGAKREEAWKAKLAKAVEALRYYAVEAMPWEADDSLIARTTLAEIKGEKG